MKRRTKLCAVFLVAPGLLCAVIFLRGWTSTRLHGKLNLLTSDRRWVNASLKTVGTFEVQVFSTNSPFVGDPSFAQDDHGLLRQRIDCSNRPFHIEMVVSNEATMLPSFDAALFNYVEEGLLSESVGQQLVEVSAQLEARNSSHLWIFKAIESASYMRWFQNGVRNIPIHVLEGHHFSSAIPHVYGYYAPGRPMPGYHNNTAADQSLDKAMAGKTHLAVWCARNCKYTFWPRTEFVHSLQKYMDVDIYGECGNLTCLPRMSQECLKLFEKYKFYFSLENSECDDYITEKLWNALVHGIVPVVYGSRKEFYARRAPPNSFIHAGDFKSGQELAKYLLYLDKSPDEYRKYFQWRSKGNVGINSPPGTYDYCDIPDLIRQVKEGKIKKKPMAETAFYNSCRRQPGYEGFNVNRVRLADWKPRP